MTINVNVSGVADLARVLADLAVGVPKAVESAYVKAMQRVARDGLRE